MTHMICITKAPTLKDLLQQVVSATYDLGSDALWTGWKDGRIYMWRKDENVSRGVEPLMKYECETGLVEVVR